MLQSRVAGAHLLVVLALMPLSFAGGTKKTIPIDSKIYVEPGEFGTYIIGAIQKKQVQVKLVSEKDVADYVITGAADTEKAGWARTLALGQTGSNENASINLTEVKSKEIIWGYNVHKRNSVHGKQSAAEACAKHLKEIVAK